MNENTDYQRTLGMALDACNACDGPVTTANVGGYCDDCLASVQEVQDDQMGTYRHSERPA